MLNAGTFPRLAERLHALKMAWLVIPDYCIGENLAGIIFIFSDFKFGDSEANLTNCQIKSLAKFPVIWSDWKWLLHDKLRTGACGWDFNTSITNSSAYKSSSNQDSITVIPRDNWQYCTCIVTFELLLKVWSSTHFKFGQWPETMFLLLWPQDWFN